jgi:hypothetical protein
MENARSMAHALQEVLTPEWAIEDAHSLIWPSGGIRRHAVHEKNAIVVYASGK